MNNRIYYDENPDFDKINDFFENGIAPTIYQPEQQYSSNAQTQASFNNTYQKAALKAIGLLTKVRDAQTRYKLNNERKIAEFDKFLRKISSNIGQLQSNVGITSAALITGNLNTGDNTFYSNRLQESLQEQRNLLQTKIAENERLRNLDYPEIEIQTYIPAIKTAQ